MRNRSRAGNRDRRYQSANATLSGGDLNIVIDTAYNGAQQTQIGTGGRYLLFAQLEDPTLSVTGSDRTSLILDTGLYKEREFITGLATFPKFNILHHNQDIGADVGTLPTETVSAWPEDGVLIDYDLELDSAAGAVLGSLTFALVAYKDADETYFILDSYPVNLAGGVVFNGIQQIALDTERGYILRTGDQFNSIFLKNSGSGAGVETYRGELGQKLKWQEWLQNNDVDPVFFDSNEPNNNLNFKTSNYSGLNGYTIRIIAIAETQGFDANGVLSLGRDIAVSGELETYDYNVPDDGTWTGQIFTLDPDTGADLGGAILANKDTLFRTVWSGGGTDLSSLYVIHRIQASNSAGDDIEELSSIRLPQIGGGDLVPKAGLSLLDVQAVSGDVHSECLIDSGSLDPNKTYNLSARIGTIELGVQFTVSYIACAMRLSEIYP